MSKFINLNLNASNYASRVLGVIKEKYGLRDKGQALDKFADLYGDEFVERDVNDEVVKQVVDSCNRHVKKYGFRSRSVKDLRKLIEET